MGRQKDRLCKLIDRLLDDPEARALYKQRVERQLTETESAEVADDIEAIMGGTPDGQELIKAYVAKQIAEHRKRKPRS